MEECGAQTTEASLSPTSLKEESDKKEKNQTENNTNNNNNKNSFQIYQAKGANLEAGRTRQAT